MRSSGDIAAQLAAWRGCAADRLDPVRFHFIEALQRRAATQEAAVQALLAPRLEALVDAYADALERALATGWRPGTTQVEAASRPRGPLALLVGQLDAGQESVSAATPSPASGVGDARGQPDAPAADAWQPPSALDEARQLWSKVRIEQQMRESLSHLPEDAGPLNSVVLVHRALTLMNTLSPEYLQHFLTYVDALVWMQRLSGEGGSVAEPARPATAKKRAAARPRKPRSPRTKTTPPAE